MRMKATPFPDGREGLRGDTMQRCTLDDAPPPEPELQAAEARVSPAPAPIGPGLTLELTLKPGKGAAFRGYRV